MVGRRFADFEELNMDGKILFRDSGIHIESGADGKLTITADGSGTDDITLDGTITINDGITLGSAMTTGITISGAVTDAILISGNSSDNAIEITGTVGDSAIKIVGTALLPAGEQAIYINLAAETVATNGIWVTLKSNVSSGDLSGLRSKVTSTRTGSAGGNPRGVYSQALVGASQFAATVEGILATADFAAGSATGVDVSCVVGHFSTGTSVTITNLAIGKFRAQTRGDETVSGRDNMMLLQNEAVGGNGRQMDSWIQCLTTNLSGGIKAAAYGIDLGTATDTLATALLRVGDDQTIASDDNQSILVDISGTANDGFIKVVVGTADKYIALYDTKTS